MKVDTSNWKEFKVSDIFDTNKAHAYNKDTLPPAVEDCNLIACITRTSINNGQDYKTDKKDDLIIEKGNALTIGGEGIVCFYQPREFVCGTNMTVLRNANLNPSVGLFLCAVINHYSKDRFSYGRAFNKSQIDKSLIKLPSTPSGDPDWKYLEEFVSGLHSKPLTTSNKSSGMALDTSDWGTFRVGNLFDVEIAKSADLGSLDEGVTKFIGRSESNNGVQSYVKALHITNGKCITVSMVGTNVAFYQETDFQASQNIATLRTDKMCKNNALFICSILNHDMKYKYSYGRTVSKDKLEKKIIKLPQKNDSPDWEFMENYIKSLPYGDRI